MSMAERFHTPSLEDASYSRFLHPSLFFQTNAYRKSLSLSPPSIKDSFPFCRNFRRTPRVCVDDNV